MTRNESGVPWGDEAPSLPDWVDLKPGDWREQPDPQRVERVWLRLEDSLVTRRKQRRWVAPAWASAAAVLVFGFGYWLGQAHHSAPVASVHVLSKEPARGGLSAAGRGPLVTEPKAESVDEPTSRRQTNSRAVRRAPTELERSPAPAVRAVPRSVPSAVAEPAVTVEDGPGSTPVIVETPVIPTWQRLANGGEYEAALYELGQAGGFEQAVVASTPEQLLLLGDIARATGQRQRAAAALRRIVNEFPNDAAAPLAAWSLGNMLERDGDSAGAIEAFSAYRALSPGGDFAEDALVRELKAAVEQGNRAQVLRLAKHYESQFPDGRRSEEVALWAAEFEVEPAADAGAPTPSGAP